MTAHDAEVLQPNQLADVLPHRSVIDCDPAGLLILVKLSLFGNNPWNIMTSIIWQLVHTEQRKCMTRQGQT